MRQLASSLVLNLESISLFPNHKKKAVALPIHTKQKVFFIQLMTTLLDSIESVSDSTERAFLTFFIPLFHPDFGANGIRHLLQRSTFLFSALLSAENVFVVTIPAMKSLVGTGKTFITGCGSSIFNCLQTGGSFGIQFTKIGAVK